MKYVVWSADPGTENDAEESRRFDSSFKTLTEANARASFLFFVKNCFGLSKAVLTGGEDAAKFQSIDPMTGCQHFYVRPDGRSTWEVGTALKTSFVQNSKAKAKAIQMSKLIEMESAQAMDTTSDSMLL